MKIIINKQTFEVIKANSFWRKLIGLMNKYPINKGMFFPKTKSIHTFFMKDNIDLIMINKDNEVVYYKKNLRKNKIIVKKEAYHTIELPSNSINKVNIGDKLTIS